MDRNNCIFLAENTNNKCITNVNVCLKICNLYTGIYRQMQVFYHPKHLYEKWPYTLHGVKYNITYVNNSDELTNWLTGKMS